MPADFSVADCLPHFPSLRAMNALRTVLCLFKVLKMREIDRFLSFLPSFLSYPSVIPLLSVSFRAYLERVICLSGSGQDGNE